MNIKWTKTLFSKDDDFIAYLDLLKTDKNAKNEVVKKLPLETRLANEHVENMPLEEFCSLFKTLQTDRRTQLIYYHAYIFQHSNLYKQLHSHLANEIKEMNFHFVQLCKGVNPLK